MDTEYDEWDDIYGEDNELEEFGCVLGDECMMPSPFHFPSECHTAEDYENDMAEAMTTDVTLQETKAAIVAMMEACGLSQVLIAVKPEYNRYTKAPWSGGGGVFYRFTDLATLAEEMRPAPEWAQKGMFDEGIK